MLPLRRDGVGALRLPPDIRKVRKVKCRECKGKGNLPGISGTPFGQEPCNRCVSRGYILTPVEPRPLPIQKTARNQTATSPDSYHPCPKCGQEVPIFLRGGIRGYFLVHHEPISTPPRVCLGSGMNVETSLKKEPRSVRWHRDQKAKRRLEAAIKKHDKKALRDLANPPGIQPEFQIRGKKLVSHSIFDMLDRPKK